MSKKDEFISAWEDAYGFHPQAVYESKQFRWFAACLDKDRDLRAKFYAAWTEAEPNRPTPADDDKVDAAAGLNKLFDFGAK